MKIFTLLFYLLLSLNCFSQEDETVAFSIIEDVPVYRGCQKEKGAIARKKCMSQKLVKLVSKKFKTKIASRLNLPDGKVKIFMSFKIAKNGKVTDIAARAPHIDLEKEAIRVANLIPKMKSPGKLRGKPVVVAYSLPIIFYVQN